MKKSSYAWIAIAVIVFVLIASGADRKIFGGKSSEGMIKQRATDFSTKLQSTRKQLMQFMEDKNFGRFRLQDPAEVLDDVVEEDRMSVLHVSGIMRTSDRRVIVASVNGSLVKPGDSVRGCEVLEVTEQGVVFDVAGERVMVPIHGEYSFEKLKADVVVLDDIENIDGQNFAVFSGRSYKAGDWVDADTRVKAVTPTMVMVSCKKGAVILKIGDSL